MRVLLIGGGGREHALACKFSESPRLTKLFIAPGNPGTSVVGENVAINAGEFDKLSQFAIDNKIDLTVVGPDNPLADGIVDHFQKFNLKIWGPTASAAKIEASKEFAKEIMIKAGVPTAAYKSFSDYEEAKKYLLNSSIPTVLKADGLAFGKGVYVCMSLEHALESLDILFHELKTEKVVIEEFMTGIEASYFVATDGERILPLGSAHDYKRIFDNDEGNNTGGMGTVSPTPNLTEDQEKFVLENVVHPVIKEMKKNGTPFCGFLYAGVMVTPDYVKVVEFNARFGDPEAQVLIPRIENDLLDVLDLLLTPGSQLPEIKLKSNSAVCVVLAAKGYPEKPETGDEITGIQDFENVKIFNAGTKLKDGKLLTSGGRVLNVVGFSKTQSDARMLAYQAASKINFEGKQFRTDIGKI